MAFDSPLWEATIAIDCPIEPLVWRGTIDKGDTQVMVEVRPDASPTILAASLGREIQARPVVLGQILLTTVDVEDALTVLLPLTSWGNLLTRFHALGGDAIDRAMGDVPPGAWRGPVEPSASLRHEVPWSTLDDRRLTWLVALIGAAVASEHTEMTPEALLAMCIERAVENEERLVATVSANRKVGDV